MSAASTSDAPEMPWYERNLAKNSIVLCCRGLRFLYRRRSRRCRCRFSYSVVHSTFSAACNIKTFANLTKTTL